MTRQDCLFYDLDVQQELVGIDINGGPVYDIVSEQEICYKLESIPICDGCKYFEKRTVDESKISELPF